MQKQIIFFIKMHITRRYTMSSQNEASPNQNFTQLLGINQKNSQSSKPVSGSCQRCAYYQRIIDNFMQKSKKGEKRQKKLRNLLSSLQMQNGLVIENTDSAVKDFQTYIIKLQNQIFERDEIIHKLDQDIQYINAICNNLSETIQQQNQKIKQFEIQHNEQIANNTKQIKQLKAHIIRQVSQKAATQRKNRQEARKQQIQKFKLKEEIKMLEEQIQGKQRLIKNLSNSNNQLRVQLIQIKTKHQIQNITWDTQRRRSFIHDSSIDFSRELKKQNDQLKIINYGLQLQLQKLLRQTQDMQTALVKTKLERDIFKNSISIQRSNSMDNVSIYGSIQNNKQPSRRYNRGQISKSRTEMAGHIRVNSKQLNSLQTSVSNQILEEDSDNS